MQQRVQKNTGATSKAFERMLLCTAAERTSCERRERELLIEERPSGDELRLELLEYECVYVLDVEGVLLWDTAARREGRATEKLMLANGM